MLCSCAVCAGVQATRNVRRLAASVDMLSPAPSPEHALLLAFPSTGRLPSTLSATDLSSVLFEAS
jgi:hypothetical protein